MRDILWLVLYLSGLLGVCRRYMWGTCAAGGPAGRSFKLPLCMRERGASWPAGPGLVADYGLSIMSGPIDIHLSHGYTRRVDRPPFSVYSGNTSLCLVYSVVSLFLPAGTDADKSLLITWINGNRAIFHRLREPSHTLSLALTFTRIYKKSKGSDIPPKAHTH